MRMRPIAATAMLTLCLTLFGVAPAQAAAFKVVVHETNPIGSMSRTDLSKMFLKRIDRWDDGRDVQPVDLLGDSATRESFTREIHDKTVAAVKSYWQRQIFSGRGTPPPELGQDGEILSFVRANPAAIGYVASGVPLGDGVKTVTVRE